MQNLSHKLVAILGYGVEGKAVTTYLLKHGVKPTLFDVRPFNSFSLEEQQEVKRLGLNFIFGPDSIKELAGFDYAFRSPGWWRLDPGLLDAEKNGVTITSQTKWFFEHCPATIIGVTGTKGKGTTCSLIANMLEQAKRGDKLEPGTINPETNVYVTGNIGKTPPLELLDQLTSSDTVVFELSSFQLQDLTTSPHIAVVLGVTSEHLDHHSSLTEYKNAQQNITKFQTSEDIAIINQDFPASLEIGNVSPGTRLYFSRQEQVATGGFMERAKLIVNNAYNRNLVFSLEHTLLRGKHNYENIAAATLCAVSLGVGTSAIQKIINEFKGLEHRLQLVGIVNAVAFYNDSFATIPESTELAVSSFTEPIVLILGGSPKGSNFNPLAESLAHSPNVKSVILIGQEGERIEAALMQAGFHGSIQNGAKSMREIFNQISLSAQPGNVVLLSPACASYDMFKNYSDRGEQFTREVKNWGSEQ